MSEDDPESSRGSSLASVQEEARRSGGVFNAPAAGWLHCANCHYGWGVHSGRRYSPTEKCPGCDRVGYSCKFEPAHTGECVPSTPDDKAGEPEVCVICSEKHPTMAVCQACASRFAVELERRVIALEGLDYFAGGVRYGEALVKIGRLEQERDELKRKHELLSARVVLLQQRDAECSTQLLELQRLLLASTTREEARATVGPILEALLRPRPA